MPENNASSSSSNNNHEQLQPSLVQLTEGKTRYILEGNRQSSDLVVCVHGIGSNSYSFEHFAKFACNHDLLVLRFDLYGRGLSDHPNLDHTAQLFTRQTFELLKSLNFITVEPDNTITKQYHITLIGHSMGGGIVVSFVDEYPQVVDQYVLMTPACAKFSLPFGSSLLKYNYLGDWIFSANSLLMDVKKGTCGEFYDPTSVENDKTIDWIVHQRSLVDQKKWEAMFLNSFRNFPLTGLGHVVKRNANVEKRALVIWAAYDTTVAPTEAFTYFWDCYQHPRTQFAVLTNTRHAFHLERIHDSNQLMVNFVKQRLDSTVQLSDHVNVQTLSTPTTNNAKDKQFYEYWKQFEQKVSPTRTFLLL